MSTQESKLLIKGDATLITGPVASGKTTCALKAMLTKSVQEGWRWGVFFDRPAVQLFDTLIEMHVGLFLRVKSVTQPRSMEEHKEAMDFVGRHFWCINAEAAGPGERLCVEWFHSKIEPLDENERLDGIAVFNWRDLAPHPAMRDYPQQLSEELMAVKRFASKKRFAYVIEAEINRGSGAYDLPCGSTWMTRIDNIITCSRTITYDAEFTKIKRAWNFNNA